MLNRLKDWRTTGPGVAISGCFIYVFQSLGCSLPTDWMTYAVAALPALLGILSKSK